MLWGDIYNLKIFIREQNDCPKINSLSRQVNLTNRPFGELYIPPIDFSQVGLRWLSSGK